MNLKIWWHQSGRAYQVAQQLKKSAYNAEGASRLSGSIPMWRRFPAERNGKVFQYSCHQKSHEQQSLLGYSPWGLKRVRHNLVTKQNKKNLAGSSSQLVLRVPVSLVVNTHIIIATLEATKSFQSLIKIFKNLKYVGNNTEP